MTHEVDSVSSHEAKAHSGHEERQFQQADLHSTHPLQFARSHVIYWIIHSIGSVADTARYKSFSRDQHPSHTRCSCRYPTRIRSIILSFGLTPPSGWLVLWLRHPLPQYCMHNVYWSDVWLLLETCNFRGSSQCRQIMCSA